MADLQAAPAALHLLGFVIFLVVGAIGVFWTRTVQSFELSIYSDLNPIPLTAMLREHVESETYVWQVRVMGAICMIAAGVFLCALLGR